MIVALSIVICLSGQPCDRPLRVIVPEDRYYPNLTACQINGMFLLPRVELKPGQVARVRCRRFVGFGRTG